MNKILWAVMATVLINSNSYAKSESVASENSRISHSFRSFDRYLNRRGLKATSDDTKAFRKGRIITVDTRDYESCAKISTELNEQNIIDQHQKDLFCVLNEDKPMISVIAFSDEEVDEDEINELSFTYSKLSKNEQTLVRETRNFAVPATALMALFFAMPAEHTGWDRFDTNNIVDRYNDHVDAGPVIDTNQWAYNWIGHPYSGAAYYTVARHAGFNKMSSFGYSFLMSTFYWEYGFEAVAEIPSIQDLIITPVLGSLLGEVFVQAEARIIENDGVILNSKLLGSTALFLVNPVEGMFNAIDNSFENHPFKETEGYFGVKPSQGGKPTLDLGIRLLF